FSRGMLLTARRCQPPAIADRFACFQTDAQAIPLPAASVDCLFSMRFLHHLVTPANRRAILHEFHRVCRRHLCLSLWVTGNLQAWRRKRLESRRPRRPYTNRIALPAATAEAEYRQAGFKVSAKLDLLAGISIWRLYVLEKC
ncbi:MAG: class I SAM-dependent methyltransferase, partial [Deltaproteobacteria bacterium]|nr:class I SAM-dependent methyltransferase [Deltaproteobacteria bacterium]